MITTLSGIGAKIMKNMTSIVFTGVLVIIILSLVYSGWDTLKGKLGFDTVKSVKAELIKERSNSDTLISVAEDLTTRIKVSEDISTAKIDAINDSNDDVNKVNAELHELLKERDRLVEELNRTKKLSADLVIQNVRIDKTTNPVSKTITVTSTPVQSGDAPPTELEKQISSVQINAIWDIYNSTQVNSNA